MATLRKTILTLMLLFSGMVLMTAVADNPLDNPPPPPGGHGQGGNQQGAPIDGGIGILLALGAGYGIYRFTKDRSGNPATPEISSENVTRLNASDPGH